MVSALQKVLEMVQIKNGENPRHVKLSYGDLMLGYVA